MDVYPHLQDGMDIEKGLNTFPEVRSRFLLHRVFPFLIAFLKVGNVDIPRLICTCTAVTTPTAPTSFWIVPMSPNNICPICTRALRRPKYLPSTRSKRETPKYPSWRSSKQHPINTTLTSPKSRRRSCCTYYTYTLLDRSGNPSPDQLASALGCPFLVTGRSSAGSPPTPLSTIYASRHSQISCSLPLEESCFVKCIRQRRN